MCEENFDLPFFIGFFLMFVHFEKLSAKQSKTFNKAEY